MATEMNEEKKCAHSSTSVPKPDPAIWMRPDELQKVKVSPYLCRGWNERDKQSDAVPLYTYPLDAQEEIDRLKAEASKREGFIDQLLSEKSGSDIANEILNCSLEHLRATRHGELIKAALLGSYGASPNEVAKLIEQERENDDR